MLSGARDVKLEDHVSVVGPQVPGHDEELLDAVERDTSRQNDAETLVERADGEFGSVLEDEDTFIELVAGPTRKCRGLEIETQTDGYFLGVVSRSDISGDAQWPDVVHISALDSSGALLAEEAVE